MKNEEFRRQMAVVEGYVLSVSDLLLRTSDDHLSCTVEGYLDAYIKDGEPSREAAALRWMTEHYESISAAVRAAHNLSEAAFNLQSGLWGEAGKMCDGAAD